MNHLDIIHSDWLIHMLKKSSIKPQERLLNLFEILDDWLDAPHAHQSIMQRCEFQAQDNPIPANKHQLQSFLSTEAAKAGAMLPEMLANQLYFMAVAAAEEKLHANNPLSLVHAKNAATALIAAQTDKQFRHTKISVYTIAASFLGALIIASSLFTFNQTNLPTRQKTAHSTSNTTVHTNLTASPQQTAALLAQLDQMRKGNCQLIEALQLPDSYKKVYFENIVSGQISTNIEDQKLAHELLNMIRCNYTPMLMANSKG